MARVGILPPGTRGFDCNRKLTTDVARFFYAARYRFVCRYVPRVKRAAFDLDPRELDAIMRAGLALQIVQHVSRTGWVPDGPLGAKYGKTASAEARDIGYAGGAVAWCDLEGVKLGTPRQKVIDYVNAWTDVVGAAGYEPGLYVGWRSGLKADDLYRRLRVRRYWSGYNLDADEFPAVRGVQMRQHVAGIADRVPVGWIRRDIDVNIIGADALGDSPVVMLAPGDS